MKTTCPIITANEVFAMMDVGVIFGSRSAEHEVSIISGLQIIENADKAKYSAFPIYISQEGEWFIGKPLTDIATYRPFKPDTKGLTRVILPPSPREKCLYSFGGLLGKPQKAAQLDCAILALHGMHGEDGTVQGLLELADIPYSSCGVTASALGMDKIAMKAVFKSMGLPVLESTYCYRSRFLADADAVLDDAEKLGYPLIVKPANLGSSIGIGRAADRAQLREAISVAAGYDRRILIEKCVRSPREINCACLGYGDEVLPSLCEEPVSWSEFLSFDAKYLGGGKGMAGGSRKLPADISETMTKRIQDYTAAIFRFFECKGVVRVDYLLDGDELYVNEINTIPGSFAYYLYEPMGITFSALTDRLVTYALRAAEEKRSSVYAYDSAILDKVKKGAKAPKMNK